MIRIRFETPHKDYRPVKWPPPYPFWKTGEDLHGNCTIVAYLETNEQLYEFWPDAKSVSFVNHVDEINFTERFPKPDWYEEDVLNVEDALDRADNINNGQNFDSVEEALRHIIKSQERTIQKLTKEVERLKE